ASGSDWLRARRVNNEIAWRDMLLDNLVTMVSENELEDPDRLIKQLEKSGEEIVSSKRELFGDTRYPDDYLQRALDRTERRHGSRLEGQTELRKKILVRMVFLLNSIAGLDKKSKLNIDVIYATSSETAGDPLASFGGFLEEAWREHDYRIGRRKAHDLLPRILNVPPFPEEEGDLYENPVDYAGVGMKDADPEKRKALRAAWMVKAENVVKANVGGGFKGWVAWKLLKGKVEDQLSKVLELD
ncbi:MAG: hypothetical protein KAJ42_13920, partial [Gemmatimonadetes bacterium]|nr:hypothetical protein [Gemmatimonadota bacterium]